MSAPIINQPWEDVADDVTGAIGKAVQPLIKKAMDDIYAGLLDATQDYLRDNLAFNIASRINSAEREASSARQEIANFRERNAALAMALSGLSEAVHHLIEHSEGVAGLHLNGDLAPWHSLTEGGQFEAWLLALFDADAMLAARQQEQSHEA